MFTVSMKFVVYLFLWICVQDQNKTLWITINLQKISEYALNTAAPGRKKKTGECNQSETTSFVLHTRAITAIKLCSFFLKLLCTLAIADNIGTLCQEWKLLGTIEIFTRILLPVACRDPNSFQANEYCLLISKIFSIVILLTNLIVYWICSLFTIINM